MSRPQHNSHVKGGMWRGLNSTPSSWGVDPQVPQTTKPATNTSDVGNAILVIPCSGSAITLFPFGGNDDNDNFGIHLHLWRDNGGLWVPLFIGSDTCTLSAAMNGVNRSPLEASDFFADTIGGGTGFDTNIVAVRSYGNDQLACIDISTVGFDLLMVQWDLETVPGADAGNVCYAIR